MRLRPNLVNAHDLDCQLAQADHMKALKPTMFGWSRAIREVLGIPASDLAKHLGISQPAMTKLEHSEEAGTISLNKLEEVASALDCDFVYGFVPRTTLVSSVEAIASEQERARKRKRAIPRSVQVLRK